MIRKFNYTNRKEIPRDKVSVNIRSVNGRTVFNLNFNNNELDFPEDAKIYIEAYYGPNYLRFDYGKFSQIQAPENTDISELKMLSERIFFRIKIVDETTESGLLLGFADKILLSDDTGEKGTQSILFVNPVLMDTTEIWRINFEDEVTGPIMEVNNQIDGIKDIAKSDRIFVSLVYPSAVRQILNKLDELNAFSNDGDDWTNKWIKFAENTLLVKNTPENNDDRESVAIWKDNVVKSFCLRFKIYDSFKKHIDI